MCSGSVFCGSLKHGYVGQIDHLLTHLSNGVPLANQAVLDKLLDLGSICPMVCAQLLPHGDNQQIFNVLSTQSFCRKWWFRLWGQLGMERSAESGHTLGACIRNRVKLGILGMGAVRPFILATPPGDSKSTWRTSPQSPSGVESSDIGSLACRCRKFPNVI
jgi:hypothetical protein